MKTFLHRTLYVLVCFTLVFGIFSNPIADAKKGKKLSKDEIAQISSDIDKMTAKLYTRSLFSPQDNEKIVALKLKLDEATGGVPTGEEYASMYYKLGFIYKERELKDLAIESFKVVLENFDGTLYAIKSKTELEKMGVKLEQKAEEASE